jgi:competence protein ComEC
MPGNLFRPFDAAKFAARRHAARQISYEPLVVVAAALAGGIVLDRAAGEWTADRPLATPAVWWLAAVGAWIVWLVCYQLDRHALGCGALLASIALGGAAWHHWQWNLFQNDELARFASDEQQPAAIEAIALRSPQQIAAPTPTPLRAIPIGERSRVALYVTALRDVDDWRPVSGACELTLDGRLTGVGAGDRVRVFAQLRDLTPPLNPGEFDYAEFARTERELCALATDSTAALTVIEPGSLWTMMHAIDRVRENWRQTIQRTLPAAEAPVAEALLLGSMNSLPRERTLPYLRTGMIHVLVVSGMHLSLLVAVFYGAMRLGVLPRRVALGAVMALVVFYVLLTGGQPPVMRAGVMAALVCLALWYGRRVINFNSLAAAAILVLAWNPAELFQVGTQLSFLCVATLIWFGQRTLERQPVDPLDRLIAFSRPLPLRLLIATRDSVWFTLSATTAVWLVALALVMSQFHLVPWAAIPISPVVFLLVGIAIATGFAWLMVGWLIPPLGNLLGMLCGCSIGAMDEVVVWTSQFEWGNLWTPGPAAWWVIGAYVLWAVLYYARFLGGVRRWSVGMTCGWIAVGFAVPLLRSAPEGLRCSFVAVGHGTCVVLQTPDRRTLLYDAGALRSPDDAAQIIASYLWSRGITRLDGIVLSHADVDHYNAVPELLDYFRVSGVYITPHMWPRKLAEGDQSAPAQLRRELEARGVRIETLEMGDLLQLGDVTAEVLHPTLLGVVGTDNANSMVLGVEYQGRRILLPGDLEALGIDFLLAQEAYDCDVLLAPHHGSLRSDPPGFAAWSMPEWVVISGNRSAATDEVAQRYQLAGARVLHTAEHGSCEFLVQEGPIELTTGRGRR